MTIIVRVQLVRLMNVEHQQVAADPQTKSFKGVLLQAAIIHTLRHGLVLLRLVTIHALESQFS